MPTSFAGSLPGDHGVPRVSKAVEMRRRITIYKADGNPNQAANLAMAALMIVVFGIIINNSYQSVTQDTTNYLGDTSNSLGAAEKAVKDIDVTQQSQLADFTGADADTLVGFNAYYVIDTSVYDKTIVTEDLIGGNCTSVKIRIQMYQGIKMSISNTPIYSWSDKDMIRDETTYNTLPAEAKNLRWEWPGTEITDQGISFTNNTGDIYFIADKSDTDTKRIYVIPGSYGHLLLSSGQDENGLVEYTSTQIKEFCISHAEGKHLATTYPNGMTKAEFEGLATSDTTKYPPCNVPIYGQYKFTATCVVPPTETQVRAIGGAMKSGDKKVIDAYSTDTEEYKIFIWAIDITKTSASILAERHAWVKSKISEQVQKSTFSASGFFLLGFLALLFSLLAQTSGV